jgi:glycine/D-amino acid oxidase-like deaminating enzyme
VPVSQAPSQAARLDTTNERLRIMLTDHTTIEARAVVIATGARYRSLPLDRWAEFEGAGIYFAATELEATGLRSGPGRGRRRGELHRPSRPPRERRPVGLRPNHHLSNGGYHLRL